MFRQYLNQFGITYNPPETGNGGVVSGNSGGTSTEMNVDDMYEFLKDDDVAIPLDEDKEDKKEKKEKKEESDDEEVEEKKPKKGKTEKEEDDDEEGDEVEDEIETDELSALEEELEEPDENKLELSVPTSRREILKKYPNIFKEFPYLETAYYREQAFTKLLPTIADAKEAVDKSQTLDRLENDLVGGNTELILKSVKDNNPKSFNKIVDGYMETLAKVDEKAFHHVIGNTIKQVIISMVQEGKSQGNEALENAAAVLNQFVFMSSKFTPPSKLSIEDTKDVSKDKEISEREQKFIRQKFDTVNGELTARVTKAYKATIDANIDPKGTMSDYVKKNASREALEELESLISKNQRFKSIVDKLWENSFRSDLDKSSVDKIQSAFVSIAKTLLPSVIKKARNEAMRGNKQSAKKDDDSHQEDESKNGNDSSRRKESRRGNESSQRKDSKSIPAGMTSAEYLMMD